MSVVEGGGASGLVQRVREILLQPKPTWEKIEGEAATIQGLYTGYVAILAAIIPVITFLWVVLISPFFGLGAPFMIAGAVIQLVGSYLIGLAGVFVFAWIANQLAPSFGGTRDLVQAFKVGAYGMTAAWVSGICLLVPVVGLLGLVAGCIYSIYLVHLGLTRLMKPPQDRAVLYTSVSVIVTGVAMAVANRILDAVT